MAPDCTKNSKRKDVSNKNLTPRAFAEVRQTRRMPLIKTEDFMPSEVKEIASMAIKRYKRLSLINHIKNPEKTLKTALSQPGIVIKYIKNLPSA
jgi:hypothetical protein